MRTYSANLSEPKASLVEQSYNNLLFLVSMRLWGTPVPIPNTMVKTQTADGTLLETARESRWMPAFIKKILYNPYGDAEHEFDSHYTVQI